MRASVYITEGMPLLRFRRRRLAGISSALAMALVLTLLLVTAASAQGRRVHQVTAGGPDACVALIGAEHPGCDGNYSLVANEFADGSVTGQYTDRFAQGDGFHAVIDCLLVVGDDAWVSGVITSGTFTDPETGEVFDLTGLFFATRVRDNGTSANDPADQISFSLIDFEPIPCTDQFDTPLFDAPEGQVIVG